MVSKVTLGILASGRGSNAQAIMDAIRRGEVDATVGIIISDNPAAPVLARAAEYGVPARCIERAGFATREAFEKAVADELAAHGVELVVLAGFMRLLSPYFINRFPGRIMNIHPSLLPAFPGLDAQGQALRYGVKVAGCTVHFVDEGMDSGPIILQEAVPVRDDDTPATLAERILAVEHVLYPRAISLYCQGRLVVDGRRVLIREGEK